MTPQEQTELDAYKGELEEVRDVLRAIKRYIERTDHDEKDYNLENYLTPTVALVLIKERIYQQEQR
jgi:hypothetical protein